MGGSEAVRAGSILDTCNEQPKQYCCAAKVSRPCVESIFFVGCLLSRMPHSYVAAHACMWPCVCLCVCRGLAVDHAG
jgi:hypothetical protein